MSTVAMTPRAAAGAQSMQEYAALLASLRALPSSAWSAPTDCTGWTVRDIVAHVVGAAEDSARPWVQARHYLPALVRDRNRLLVDKVNDAQLADRRTATPDELMAELESLAPKAARGVSGCPRCCAGCRCRPLRADCPVPHWATSATSSTPVTSGCTESTSRERPIRPWRTHQPSGKSSRRWCAMSHGRGRLSLSPSSSRDRSPITPLGAADAAPRPRARPARPAPRAGR